MFSILKSYITLGSLSSLTLFMSAITALVVGKFSDINRRLVLRIGAILTSMSWLLRFLVKTSLHVFLVDAFYGVAQIIAYIPMDALTYDKANESDIVEYITFREISIHSAGTLFFLGMVFVTNLKVGFGLAGIGSLLIGLF